MGEGKVKWVYLYIALIDTHVADIILLTDTKPNNKYSQIRKGRKER